MQELRRKMEIINIPSQFSTVTIVLQSSADYVDKKFNLLSTINEKRRERKKKKGNKSRGRKWEMKKGGERIMGSEGKKGNSLTFCREERTYYKQYKERGLWMSQQRGSFSSDPSVPTVQRITSAKGIMLLGTQDAIARRMMKDRSCQPFRHLLLNETLEQWHRL